MPEYSYRFCTKPADPDFENRLHALNMIYPLAVVEEDQRKWTHRNGNKMLGAWKHVKIRGYDDEECFVRCATVFLRPKYRNQTQRFLEFDGHRLELERILEVWVQLKKVDDIAIPAEEDPTTSLSEVESLVAEITAAHELLTLCGVKNESTWPLNQRIRALLLHLWDLSHAQMYKLVFEGELILEDYTTFVYEKACSESKL